jgi:hypothetical protein
MGPFTPMIVRSFVNRPVDSPEWWDAAGVAGDEEIAFALEIVAQRKRQLVERISEIEAELIELERGY